MATDTSYPVQFSVDYPDRELNRLTTAFRTIWIIPIAIVLALVSGGGAGDYRDAAGGVAAEAAVGGSGVLFLPVLLMILFRQKYPRWWFDWNLQFMRFGARVTSYLTLLRDEYPSTDEEQAVHLNFPYPDAKNDLNGWLPLVKWLLAVPHYIVLFFLFIAAIVVVIVAWFEILFTGRYSPGLFDFVVGVGRWSNRVTGYALVLVTDRYPPFRLGP